MQFWRFSRSLLCHGGFHFIIVFCSDWYKLLLLLFYSWAPARREGKALQRGRISKRNYWNTVVRAPTYLRMYGLLFIYFLTRTKERNARTVSSSRTILTCLHNRRWKIIKKIQNWKIDCQARKLFYQSKAIGIIRSLPIPSKAFYRSPQRLSAQFRKLRFSSTLRRPLSVIFGYYTKS